ncbi:metallophosphoesterase [Sulfitobacter sp. F26204]|uniref:metallophosphoesterase n=1 Tax=Sulfitobacter sp. F26204 TaxID=2996014 RepID=UPI00225DDC62|nr:metallophosphoesterase [Sulfitobacter sp. F26204]MCX7561618.1 metallophosphoesterase [Sulfitobacter sp. F26204]
MFNQLKSLLSKSSTGKVERAVDLAQIAPDQRLLVVGDVHGCLNLLLDTIKRLEAHIETVEDWDDLRSKLVFVGDYVDRGEQSAQTLNWLHNLQKSLPYDVECLMGNHERMMLDFLDDPAGRGARWLRNGGLQTLASYKIGGVRERSNVEELTEASMKLEAAMPEGQLEWLRQLPKKFKSGNVCVAHAAMDPHLSPEDQSTQTLMWGHNEFMTTPRDDDLWVVHGHTIVKEPRISKSRISIDTGAYHSGKLTLALIEPGVCTFF